MKQAKRESVVRRRDFLKMSLAGGAAALGVGVSAPAIGQSVKTIRFGHMLPTDQIHHKAILVFADEIAKMSGNKIKVEIFPSSQLGTIPEMLQSVQAGSLTMSMAVPAWYSSFMKPVDAFTLPYLVANADKLRTALDGNIGSQIAKMGEAADFKVLGYFLLGGRHIVNKVRAGEQAVRLPGPEAARHQQPRVSSNVPRCSARIPWRWTRPSCTSPRSRAWSTASSIRCPTSSRRRCTRSSSSSRSTSTPPTSSSSRPRRRRGTRWRRRSRR